MSATLFYDGIFHSGITEDDVFSCMEVQNGRITAVYKERPEGGKYKKEISLGGKHVYPCLIDGHVHMLFSIAVMAMGFDVCEIRPDGVFPNTMKGIEERIRKFAASKPRNAIIAANNYILTAVDEGRLPNRTELDDWAGGRAIVIYNIDGHSTALSSKMLEKLGIDPVGHDGILVGEDNERNQGKLTDIIGASISLPVLAKGIANFQNACAVYGINIVAALEGNGDSPKDPTTKLIMRLARHFDIGVRFYFQYFDIDRVEKLKYLQRHPRIGGCGDWEMDGSVGSHTAAFKVPYNDTGTTSPCYYNSEQLEKTVAEADERGFQVASHAIGECAIDMLADALNKCDGHTFHRIEHCEFISNETFEKLQPQKYAIMMQPGYAWIDRHYLHTYSSFLTDEIINRMKLKSLYDKMCVCGSSDSPVQSIDPYLQMLGMTDFYIPKESLSPFEAFRAYTLNPARAILEEKDYGTLELGKHADFFTADEDFFRLSPQEISGFHPLETYYGGIKYRAKSGSVAELLMSLLKKPKKI